MPKIIKTAKGTFTTANITIDSSGRVITAASGAGGDGSFFPRVSAKGPASGNFATPANATKYYAYAFAGGGGGGGRSASNQAQGGAGGTGGFAIFAGDCQASTTYAYAAGGAGNAGNGGNPVAGAGGAGGATTVTNLFTASGGNGGSGAPRFPANPAPPGNTGATPGSVGTIASTNYLFGESMSAGGNRNSPFPAPGNAGGAGGLTVYDDGGVD